MELRQALDLAGRFHAGQTDKAGHPYLGHVMRVVELVDGEDEKLVAAMHDLLEDTVLTATDLHSAGAPPRIVAAVEALTRADGETYGAFIDRACADQLARSVKLADLADNSDEGRLAELDPEEAARLRTKYRDALHRVRTHAPLPEGERAADASRRSGIPAGAEDIGRPQGSQTAWSSFWCEEDGCGRPAGTLSLVKTDVLHDDQRGGLTLLVSTFLGSTCQRIDGEDLLSVEAALEQHDARFLRGLNSELVAFWCFRCERSFCGAHWRSQPVYDDGYFDYYRGWCPRQHVQKLWD